jgi:hypothetical protein
LQQPVAGQTVTVRGRTEPGAQVTINGQTVTADAAGNFELQVVAGTQPIHVEAVDGAGNRMSVEIETK